MDTKRHKQEWFQCTACGHVHQDYTDEVIDLKNRLYYATACSHCRGVTKHLWIGESEDEIYELYDNTLDARYY